MIVAAVILGWMVLISWLVYRVVKANRRERTGTGLIYKFERKDKE